METDNNKETLGDIVYILINEAMPGYIKIGITRDLKARIKQLSDTSVPVPFECVYAKRVRDARAVENKLHTAYAKDRVDSGAGREFFMIPAEQAAAALSLAEGEDVSTEIKTTEQEANALDEVRKRRPSFRFSMVDVKPGAVLLFSMDESITCEVVDDKSVKFHGEIISLTEAAMRVLESMDIHWKAVSGPGIWTFEGENLYSRRLRLEAGE